MKRQILRVLLGLIYMTLLVLLLWSQFRAIAVPADEWTAILVAVVIGVPWLLVLRLYMKTSEVKRDTDTVGREQNNAALQETIVDKDVDIRTVRGIFESAVKGYGLTEREKEVAWLLYRGYTNRQIGEELFIAETTVKKHVSHIYEKMQVMCRKEFRYKVGGGTPW